MNFTVQRSPALSTTITWREGELEGKSYVTPELAAELNDEQLIWLVEPEAQRIFDEARARLTKDTLNWVNTFRATLGLNPLPELPKGERQSAPSCPIARAVADGLPYDVRKPVVHGGRLYLGAREAPLPGHVKVWVREFDQGLFPEYELV